MRPLTPPDLLARSTAIWVPTSAVLPPAAAAPLSGWSVPIFRGLAWPKASRHGAGTSMLAPRAPAVAAPTPSSRRRVTLPLYQKPSSFAQGSSFHCSAMSCPPLGRLVFLLRYGLERLLEDLNCPPDFFLPVNERDVELRGRLDDAAPDHLLGEGCVERAVGRERGAVVRNGPVGEVDLEDGRFPYNLGGEPRFAHRLGEPILEPRARREEALVGPGLAQLAERRQPRRRGDRVAVERAGLEDHLARAFQLLREVAHDVAAAHDGGQR